MTQRRYAGFVLPVVLCVFGGQPAPALAEAPSIEPFFLVRDGQPAATVVYAGDDPVLRASVADLAHYVEQISGAKIQVTQGVEDTPGPTLHVGETRRVSRLSPALDAVKVDGFAMAAAGEDLVIAGRIPQGTANGVMSVLQAQFGVRWYYGGPLWETVPERSTLAISFTANRPDNTRVENPSFLGRHAYNGVRDKNFQRRLRLTLPGVTLPYQTTGHHLVRVVNPNKFPDRPDYFAWWDGRHHLEHDVHPCFTHPDMLEIFLDDVRQGHGSFGVNDNLSACRCERCLAVDGESEPYMGMVNVSESYCQLISRVAAEAAKIKPEMRLSIFAYQLTNAPPKTVDHLGENVDVVLCQDTSQYFDARHKQRDQRMSREWAAKCGHVRFYDYVGISYWTPRYFPGILADQIKHLADTGVSGYGTHSSTMIDSSMPMYYLLSRLLWDASLDPAALVDEMIADLYGSAAGPISRFYDHWGTGWQRQATPRWLYGMDNFRGEMSLYTWEDFEKGQSLLNEAAALADDDKIRRRIAYLQERYAFTYDSARAFTVSMNAIRWEPTTDHADAIRLSNDVVDIWRRWAKRLEDTLSLEGTPVSTWIGKPERVRIWALKQQMRDGVLAPLIRWVCANEGRIAPEELRRIEHVLAGVGMLNRSRIEQEVTQCVEAVPYLPRVDGLLVADIPKARAPLELNADAESWNRAGALDAAPWVFHDQKKEKKIGKYEDPVAQHHRLMDQPPPRDDVLVNAQAAWDDQYLYFRVDVRDERQLQDQPPSDMWKQDSIRIALTPDRDNFLYDVHSWTYIWGGYRGCELEFGVSLQDDAPRVHVEATPEPLADKLDPKTLIRANARRHHPHTVYEVAIDWRLLPRFTPAPERSLGLWLVVNDADKDDLVSAEYGSSINRVKRPTGFSAIRLAEQPIGHD